MPRSSRHRSHKGHKRDARSDSEDEVIPKVEDFAGGGGCGDSGTRVLKDLEQEKRKSSANEKNGDLLVEYGKKRKDRGDDLVAGDRWFRGDEADGRDRVTDKKLRNDEFGFGDSEKKSKSKALATVDSKSAKSSSRHEAQEKNEDLSKQRTGKELTRRESSSSQYKDVKDRERERGSERDKKVHDAKQGKNADSLSTKERSKREEEGRKKDVDSAEWQIEEEMRNPELEKELEKRIKRRKDEPTDKDKWLGDGRDGGNERLSLREDRTKNGGYDGDKYIDGTGRDKHREEGDKNQRHRGRLSSRDDKNHKWDEYYYRDEKDKKLRDDHSSRDERDKRHRDDHSSREEMDYKQRDENQRDDHASRGRANDRSDSRHFRDKKSSDSPYKRSKYYDTDNDGGSYIDDHGGKCRETRGTKRISDENDVEKITSSMGKFDSDADRSRVEHSRSEKVDSTLSNNKQKYSSTSSVHVKNQIRYNSKQTESTRRGSPSDDRLRLTSATSRDRTGTSTVIERVSESRSVLKIGPNEESYSSEFLVETTSSRYDRTSKSEAHVSPNKNTAISPGDRRLLDRIDSRRSIDIEDGSKRSFKDARETFNGTESMEKPNLDDTRSRTELITRESTPVGSSSINRTSYLSGSSSHLLPPSHVRYGIDSPLRGSYDEDIKGHSGERKANGRFRRTGDLSVDRGPGTNWRSAWPSPVANGFLPPPTGFHPNVQRFPGPHLFGIRSPMDLSHTGIPLHVHEAADRFSVHGRPFGWRSQMDESYSPHLQVWDGSNGMFGDESHAYGRPEWDQNRLNMGSRGWKMGPDLWRGQNESANMKLTLPQEELQYTSHALPDEAWAGQSANEPPSEEPRSERFSNESVGVKRTLEVEKISAEAARESSTEKTPELIKDPHAVPTDAVKSLFDDDNSLISSCYLSKVEISMDLAPRDLYEKCMSHLKTGVSDDVQSVEVPQVNNVENNMVDTRSSGYIISHLFPATADDAFQRAVSLYKMQSAGIKAKASLTLQLEGCISKDNCSSQPSGEDVNMIETGSFNEEKVNVVETRTHPSQDEQSQPATTSINNIEEESNLAMSADDGTDGDMKEPQSKHVTGSLVFLEGQPCEALFSECRVNLSRIPNSPESTH